MTNELKFFGDQPNIIKSLLKLIFLFFCGWIWFAIFSNEALDPLHKTIAVTIAAFGTFLVVYSFIEINKVYLDLGRSQIVNKRGTIIFPKNNCYPFANINAIDLRLISNTHHDSDSHSRSVTTTYYAVLRLDDDEIYLEGSNDEEETKTHVKQLAKDIGKPFYVNFNARNKSKKFSRDFKVVRTLSLLLIVLVAMYGLFVLFSKPQ